MLAGRDPLIDSRMLNTSWRWGSRLSTAVVGTFGHIVYLRALPSMEHVLQRYCNVSALQWRVM